MNRDGQPVIEKLTSHHDVAPFDCGNDALNRFLQRFALTNQRADNSQTYVVVLGDGRVGGYYTLAVGGVEHHGAPDRVARGQPRHPIPIMLLARLAIDQQDQGQGLGRALLRDALLRTVMAADIAGIRAIVIHAKDDAARRWYHAFDFQPSPTDPLHLFLLMKDIRLSLEP